MTDQSVIFIKDWLLLCIDEKILSLLLDEQSKQATMPY
jgi:hypothetical protein